MVVFFFFFFDAQNSIEARLKSRAAFSEAVTVTKPRLSEICASGFSYPAFFGSSLKGFYRCSLKKLAARRGISGKYLYDFMGCSELEYGSERLNLALDFLPPEGKQQNKSLYKAAYLAGQEARRLFEANFAFSPEQAPQQLVQLSHSKVLV